MNNGADKQTFVCENCNNEVKEDDDFCTDCGTLFIENIYCENHTDVLADGVCVICSTPYCKSCGCEVNKHFLCNEHSEYEIYENMVKVYGTLDDLEAQFLKSCLEDDELHPMLYCRVQAKNGPRFVNSLFGAVGEYRGNIVNEIKILVPFQELIKSEELLKSINENK